MKTGTTAIQNGLELHADALGAAGIRYVWFKRGRRLWRSWDLPAELQSRSERRFATIRANNARLNPDHVLISWEGLRNAPPRGISGLIDQLGFTPSETSVVCYVRRPSEYWISAEQEWLKKHSRFRSGSRRCAFRAIIERWEQVVGRERMLVRAYARPGAAGGAFEDFCDNVLRPLHPALHHIELHDRMRLRNVSLSAEGLVLWQRARALLFSAAEGRHTTLSRLMLEHLQDAHYGAYTRLRLTPKIATSIDASHAADLAWLAERYGVSLLGCMVKEGDSAGAASAVRLGPEVNLPAMIEPPRSERVQALALAWLASLEASAASRHSAGLGEAQHSKECDNGAQNAVHSCRRLIALSEGRWRFLVDGDERSTGAHPPSS